MGCWELLDFIKRCPVIDRFPIEKSTDQWIQNALVNEGVCDT